MRQIPTVPQGVFFAAKILRIIDLNQIATTDRLSYVYFEDEPGRRAAAKLLTRDEARQATSSFGRYQEELSVTCRWQGSFRRCLLTLEPCSFHAFSKSSFVGLLLALLELAIMARDDAVTKPHIGRRLGFSQQLKFRGALSVKQYPCEIVQY
jgi:hypothetical protein